MRDSELAAGIVDGDARALAEAYDKYADMLWSYSRSVLSDADRAAEVVADTFVIAASRLDVLPVSGRLRAWLYAVARNECQRQLRSVKGESAACGAERLRHAAEVLSTGEQRQLRALLTAAFGGLDAAERDVMEMVWHGLDLAEVAAVLRLSRSEAYTLFTRARDQLEASVGVLLMGWTGRGGCDAFEDMLYGKDASLTPELRTRLGRHIAKCETCADRYREQMRPSLTLCLSVGALLSEAADARAAASPVPVSLWEQVYQMTSSPSPEASWQKVFGGRRVSFGPDGFPRQAAALREGLGRTPLKVAAVGAVALAATATGWATHGHFIPRTNVGARPASPAVTEVMPDARAAMASGGAHAGPSSPRAASRHQPQHAKPAPARSVLLSAPSAGAVGSVPGGGGASAPSAAGPAPAPAASGSGSVSSKSGSGSSSGGSSPAPAASTSPSTPKSTTSGPGLLKTVVSTSKNLTSTLGLP